MRYMATPHLTSVTAWRLVQGSNTCSLKSGQHLSQLLKACGLPFPSVSLPCGLSCLVCTACA